MENNEMNPVQAEQMPQPEQVEAPAAKPATEKRTFGEVAIAVIAALLIVAFTTLQSTFSLHLNTNEGKLLAVTLLIMTPTVFTFFQRVFDTGDWIIHKLSRKKQD